MTTYRAQVSLPFFTNFPEDVITNTFHFEDFNSLGINVVANTLTPRLDTFYTSVYGTATYAANYVVWSLATVSWYDLSQPEPRVPLTLPMPITTTASATTIPTEVAIVLSFQGLREPGIPQARRRGRIYLGGLGAGWFGASSASNFPVVSSSAIGFLTTAANTLRTNAIADALTWRVWSPTDQESTAVVNGWCDNSPDTQRRRSVDASLRTTWGA